MCVCVSLLVPNLPLQSDSPLSGIKKGGGWLVWLVAGAWCFFPTLNNTEGLELDWTFSTGSPYVKTLQLGQVLRGPGETTLDSSQDSQRTKTVVQSHVQG